MKTDELMLGNWVRIEGQPFRITAIHGKEIPSPVGTYPYTEEDIYTIGLTYDILEKNGFEIQCGWGLTKRAYNSEHKISIMKSLLDYTIYLNEHADEQIGVIPSFSCGYIHELQNFLKLKKIDLKITL